MLKQVQHDGKIHDVTLNLFQGLSNWKTIQKNKQTAFTLAEVLITLVIIGIIAAITVPMIHANYKKQETVAKLKKTYSVLSQLVKLSQLDNGPADEWFNDVKDSPEILFDKYFRPYLKNAKLAKDSYFYTETYPFKYINGTNNTHNTQNNSKRITFSLDDGTIVIVFNQNATVVEDTIPIWIDINGGKKPNTWGKDVFIMRIYKDKGLFPSEHFLSDNSVKYNCSLKAPYGGSSCFEKIMRDGWEIKNDYPW